MTPFNINSINLFVRHKKTKELMHVLLICFVNRYVDVLPENNLEGGEVESLSFHEVEFFNNIRK